MKGDLRLRIFAGPNGSGKSTIFQEFKSTKVDGRPLDLGIYINPDEITVQLREDNFVISNYKISITKKKLIQFALVSGLLRKLTPKVLPTVFHIYSKKLILKDKNFLHEFAQILARYLREALLDSRQRFSLETVFSHPSNVSFMEKARKEGYKVYLYFVTTISPEINKDRVRIRVQQGGHNIPPQTIEDRYYRSMKLLYSATKPCYQCFFFDNSSDEAELVNHFKIDGDHLKFDYDNPSKFPKWFRKYYWNKKFKKYKRRKKGR